MTRLFGCICNQPQRLDEALEGVRSVLTAPAPVSRWGLGYVHSGEVLLTLHPRPSAGEVDFHSLLSGLNSDYIIGWAGEEDELRGDANTQPLRYRRWLFAQEGVGPSAAEFHEVLPHLVQHIPDYLRRNIRGRSPAEHIFHLFLSMLHDAGTLDDPNLAPSHIRRAVRDTLALVQRVAATRTGHPWPLGNIILSNSRSMLAVRLSAPLDVRRLKQQTDPRRPESEFKAVLVVSSPDLRGESGFEELPPSSALAINRDVTTDIVELDS
jgi:glutamine amidotransferase